MKNITYLLFIPLLAMLYQACSPAESAKSIPGSEDPVPVKIIQVQQEEISDPVLSSGHFFTDDETTLAFKTGGIVEEVNVTEGQAIRKGQLLAKLNLTEIQSAVSQATLAQQKAERDLQRTEILYHDSVATLEQVQNARTAFALASEQLKATRFNLSYSEIRAPADGFVLKKFVNAGQMVSQGTPIVQINGAAAADWIFRAAVSDREWARLQEGDSAMIQADAFEESVPAVVLHKSEGADPLNGAFSIEIQVINTKDYALASGLFGTLTVFPAQKNKVWNIPHEALLDAEGDQGYVFTTTDQKTAHRRLVEIAGISQDFVQIGKGLEDEPAIISRGSAYLTEGSPIMVMP
jgi:RND family efflux transporter MFP subunit